MNKFKAWLIHKLGGYTEMFESTKIIYKEVPSVTFKCSVSVPFGLDENETDDIVRYDAAEKIGNFIIANHLYDVDVSRDMIRDCKILQYTVRAMKSTQDMRVIKDD